MIVITDTSKPYDVKNDIYCTNDRVCNPWQTQREGRINNNKGSSTLQHLNNSRYKKRYCANYTNHDNFRLDRINNHISNIAESFFYFNLNVFILSFIFLMFMPIAKL